MIGRSTKKPPPAAEDYARRDPGTWSSAAPPPQARRYGESRSAWEARRPKPGSNANASVYVPHFLQENQQRIPGRPFELRVHVRMKNKDLVHVFSDLTEDQTFLSLRELCRKTFPTFGRRLSALEWHADGVRVCPSFSAGRMASLQECGLADARRVEARVVYGRTNDRAPDAPPDSIHAIVACDLSRYGPLALAGSTKTVKVFLEEKATGRRVREAVRDAAATAGDLDLATEDGGVILDDQQLRRDVDVDDRLFAYRRQRVACCFGQLPGSATPFRAPPPAVWSDVEQLIRDAGPPLPRNCAFFCCEPVASDAVSVQVRSLRRLDAEPDACAAGLLGCDRAVVGVVAVPLPTARSPPPDSEGVGTDVVCRCIVHLASDEGASLHLERVFADDGADGAWNAGEDVSDDDDQVSREQQCALSHPERFTRDQLAALNLTVEVSRDVAGDCTYDAETGALTFRPSVRLESNTKYKCVVRAGRYDYVTSIAGDWCFSTGEGLTQGNKAYGGLVERLRGSETTFDDESRSTWTQRAHVNAALMKPVVAKPAVDEEEENEGPLSKNKARRMRKQLLHREDELRALSAVHAAQQAMLRREADIVHRRLAQYKGEKLEGLDVKTLGVLLAEMDAARTRVEAARQRKLLTSCPDDFVCPITQELMVDPHVCADGHSYEHHAISAWLERHDTSPQTNLPLAHKHLVPNITLRNAIGAFREANPEQT